MATFDDSMLDTLEDPQVREQLLEGIPSQESMDARLFISRNIWDERVHRFLLEHIEDQRLRKYLRIHIVVNDDFRCDFLLKYPQDTRLRSFLQEYREDPSIHKFLQSYGERYGIAI